MDVSLWSHTWLHETYQLHWVLPEGWTLGPYRWDFRPILKVYDVCYNGEPIWPRAGICTGRHETAVPWSLREPALPTTTVKKGD